MTKEIKMPAKITKTATVQMECRKGDVEWNLKHSVELIHESMKNKVDLICFPESVLDGYACGESEHARPVTGHEVKAIAELAKSYSVWILWSLAESVNGRTANTVLLFDRNGEIKLHYRKAHLCLEAEEHKAYLPGQEFPVTSVDGVLVGALICFDRHYPEAARELRLQGAQLILHPTATDWFKPDKNSLNTAMMRTRAYENRCFILSINQVNYEGGSALFSPWGEVIALAGEKEEILYWDIDFGIIDSLPENHFELLSPRRPELYSRIPHCDAEDK
jgi:predicted amidohydrolase